MPVQNCSMSVQGSDPGARLVANPGCYPTSVQLPLCPLLEAGLVEKEDIIVDAKSGVSGAGELTGSSQGRVQGRVRYMVDSV